ncbi:MAG: phosphate acyltransferase PlsX [Oligoflexia bacterium]|nr:phosphate acyltransferase PlsX [Oligoflexia bacterium]
MKISVDAYGGDHAPEVNIRGALDFLNQSQCHVLLTGNEAELKSLVGKGHPRLTIVDAPEKIDMAEKASPQLRTRKNTSMYRCVDLVVQKEAQACLSAGSSAAFMALSVLLLKRLGQVERPALITPIPTIKDYPTYCLDMGANVDCKPLHLVHFALMGHCYTQIIRGITRPRLAVLSNGEEESKGNDLTRETHEILKSLPGINYAGYCEGRDIFTGDFDVVVSDGFVGNVVLKTAEGLSEALMNLLKQSFTSSTLGKIGFLLARSNLRSLKTKLDYAQYGAAPLLGVGGLSLICHGRSSAEAIKNGLRTAEKALHEGLVHKMSDKLEESTQWMHSHLHHGFLGGAPK